MTPATRITTARLAAIERQLGPRERLIVGMLSRIRLASTRQIETLHFTNGTPLSNARAARRVLNRLLDLGLVSRMDRQVGGKKGGSAGYVWGLGVTGQHLVGQMGPAGGVDLRRPWTVSAAFVDHRLAITRLLVDLVVAGRHGGGQLESFTAEPDCWRRYTGQHGAVVTLKPDAFVVIGQGEYLDAWFIEVDRASESLSVIDRKCRAVIQYYQSGREQARTGVFPWVIFSVPDEKREAAIHSVLRRLSERERTIFRVARDDETAAVLMIGGSS